MKDIKLCNASHEQCKNEKCFDRARLSVVSKLARKGVKLNDIEFVDLTQECDKRVSDDS